jgi:hypothetical protein
MKKRNLFALLLVLNVFLTQAQSSGATLYGFRQRSTGGAQRTGSIDENGKTVTIKPTEVFQYNIYVSTKSKTRIYPVQLWINGEAFSVKGEPFNNNPVVPANGDAPASRLKPLIPETAGKVWKLKPLPLVADKSGGRAKALAINNDVVVLYKMGGKLRYAVLKKFTELDPVSLP